MLNIDDVKLHLRVDGYDEDDLIEALMTAATAATANYLDLPLEQMTTTVPSPIKAATLLLVADLYENRSAQTERPLHHNEAYERLLQPYRTMTA